LIVCIEVLKNIWFRTYAAGAYTTNYVSKKLGASDDRAIIRGTLCVRDDWEISVIKVGTNVIAWEMKQKLVFKSILKP